VRAPLCYRNHKSNRNLPNCHIKAYKFICVGIGYTIVWSGIYECNEYRLYTTPDYGVTYLFHDCKIVVRC